jgi:hypothetical protein
MRHPMQRLTHCVLATATAGGGQLGTHSACMFSSSFFFSNFALHCQ